MNIRFGIAACIALTASAGISAAAVLYSVTDLGTFGGVSSTVNSINNSGQVVGWYENADRSRYSFLYDHGVATPLGTLGGTSTVATSINNGGQIVGLSFTDTNRGFIYQNGAMSDLIPNGPVFFPKEINDAGQVSGFSSSLRASLLSNGTITDLGTPTGFISEAHAINNHGEIVGWYDRARPSGAETRAFLHSGGKLIDLGTLYGNAFLEVPFTSAESINELGQIVGRGSTAIGDMHAFLYSGGVIRDLGTLGGRGSAAYGINNLGEIVGNASTAAPQGHAFIYRDGAMSDLNDLIAPGLGWTIQSAWDINDLGQIVGVGVKEGVSRGIVLTPVPELAKLGLLLPLSVLMRRRKR